MSSTVPYDTTPGSKTIAKESFSTTKAVTAVSLQKNDSMETSGPHPAVTYKSRAPKDYGVVKAKEITPQKQKEEKEESRKNEEAAKKNGNTKDKPRT